MTRVFHPVLRWFRFLPVIERELRQASRGQAAYRWRFWMVGLGLGLMALLTLSQSGRGDSGSSLGQFLFRGLTVLAAIYAALAGAVVTADAVSREKREGTLGLLFLTDLRGIDVVLGKLAASSIHTLYGLMGLAPLLAIPVMLGGVTIQAGLLATLAVVNLLFVSLAFGMAVSAISWDERRAVFAAVTVCVGSIVGPFIPLWFLERFDLHGFIAACSLSPAIPVVLALNPVDMLSARTLPLGGWGTVPVPVFTLSLLLLLPSHLLGWLVLALAGRWTGGVWHSRRSASVKRTLDERVFSPRNPQRRAVARARLLEVHPLVWLLERHPGKRFYADGLVLALLLIWANGYRSHGTDMFGGPTWFLIMPIAVLTHLVFASWVVAETSLRWIQDRRSGAMELLLSTGLSDRTLVDGYRTVLRRLFFRPLLVLAAAEVFVAFFGFDDYADSGARRGRAMLVALASVLLLDTYGLSWIALRLAAVHSTVNRVGVVALAITPGMPLLAALFGIGIWNAGLGRDMPVSFEVGLLVWIVLVALVNLVGGAWWCRRWVLRELRSSATRLETKPEVRPG